MVSCSIYQHKSWVVFNEHEPYNIKIAPWLSDRLVDFLGFFSRRILLITADNYCDVFKDNERRTKSEHAQQCVSCFVKVYSTWRTSSCHPGHHWSGWSVRMWRKPSVWPAHTTLQRAARRLTMFNTYLTTIGRFIFGTPRSIRKHNTSESCSEQWSFSHKRNL